MIVKNKFVNAFDNCLALGTKNGVSGIYDPLIKRNRNNDEI